MVRLCISCGATPAPEARFCRQCGTPLVIGARSEGEPFVSPRAPTVPLEPENWTTGGLDFRRDTREGGDDTGRISREEIERILRERTGERGLTTDLASGAQGFSTPDPITTSLDSSSSGPIAPPAGVDSVSRRLNARRNWLVLATGLLCVGCVAAGLAIFASRRINRQPGANGTPITLNDPNSAFEEQFTQAESLYESGDMAEALVRLKAAARLAPSRFVDQRRVGSLFMKLGATEDALKYLNQAVLLDAGNVDGWRSLAESQFKAGRYLDSAASYNRILSIVGDNPQFESLKLEYARALRMSGKSDEARMLLERTSRSADKAVSASAKRQLQEVESEGSTPGEPGVTEATNTVNVQPEANAGTPGSQRNNLVAGSVKAIAGRSPDSLYDEGIRILGGRDLRKLQRAELVRALELFQYAAQSGTRRSEAARHAEQLGKEFDRRKNWR